MKDTAEKVVKEIFMRPWGGEDKLVMSVSVTTVRIRDVAPDTRP